MATQKAIVITLESSSITKKGDKVALNYAETEHKTIYIDLKKHGSDFAKGDRVLVEVIEKKNEDGTFRFEILSVDKLNI